MGGMTQKRFQAVLGFLGPSRHRDVLRGAPEPGEAPVWVRCGSVALGMVLAIFHCPAGARHLCSDRMPGKILLVNANRCTRPDPVFPLGLAHLSAALRHAGHKVAWLDTLADAGRFDEIIAGYQPDLVGMSLRNIDDVLIGKRETFFDDALSLAARIRQKLACPIVLGGSGFSIFPQRLLELTGADFGVCGEGEAALVALVAAVEKGGAFTGIPGLVFRQNGKIVLNPPASAPPNGQLDDADWPAAITDHYLRTSGMLNVQTQRGCGFRCGYCTYPLIEGKQHRRRPAELVADEFAQLQRLGARYVFIVDSVFNSSHRHVTEICEAILRRKMKLSWGCFLRPQGLTAELMKLMAQAGLAHIEFGSDSFCDEVLAAYQKDFTFDDILHSSELARQAEHRLLPLPYLRRAGRDRTTRSRGVSQFATAQGRRHPGSSGMPESTPARVCLSRPSAKAQISRDADLLTPRYYLAPGLTEEAVFAQLQEFARLSPNWIVGDPAPGYASLVERLRQRGVVGPLWSYFAMLQRIQPQTEHGRVMTKRLLLISPVASTGLVAKEFQFPAAGAGPVESGGAHARLVGR